MSTRVPDDTPIGSLAKSKSKYLAKDDAGEDGLILTVRGFKVEEIENNGEVEEKTVLYFVEEDIKPMILNVTNAQLLKMATGAETAGETKGKQIVVFNDPNVSFGGKVTGGLRIKKLPSGKGPRAAGQPQQPAEDVPDEDSIPF